MVAGVVADWCHRSMDLLDSSATAGTVAGITTNVSGRRCSSTASGAASCAPALSLRRALWRGDNVIMLRLVTANARRSVNKR